jgi:hypothetical protein
LARLGNPAHFDLPQSVRWVIGIAEDASAG